MGHMQILFIITFFQDNISLVPVQVTCMLLTFLFLTITTSQIYVLNLT